MEGTALFSRRTNIRQLPHLGEVNKKRLTGMTAKNPKFAYQAPIYKHSDPVNLVAGATLDTATPFSQAIRVASFNLNADTAALKFVPRSGLLPRVTDWEVEPQYPIHPVFKQPGEEDKKEEEEAKKEGGGGDGGGGGGDGGNDNGARRPFDSRSTSALASSTDSGSSGNTSIKSENDRPMVLTDLDRNAEDTIIKAVAASYKEPDSEERTSALTSSGFQYDASQSSEETAVYKNPKTNSIVVSFRGTQNAGDVLTDVGLATVGVTKTSRYGKDKQHIERLLQENPESKITVVGHSLGGTLSTSVVRDLVNMDPSLENRLYGVSLNPGSSLNSTMCSTGGCANTYEYRVKGDPISASNPNAKNTEGRCPNDTQHSLSQFTGQCANKEQTIGTTIKRGVSSLVGTGIQGLKNVVAPTAKKVADKAVPGSAAVIDYVTGSSDKKSRTGERASSLQQALSTNKTGASKMDIDQRDMKMTDTFISKKPKSGPEETSMEVDQREISMTNAFRIPLDTSKPFRFNKSASSTDSMMWEQQNQSSSGSSSTQQSNNQDVMQLTDYVDDILSSLEKRKQSTLQLSTSTSQDNTELTVNQLPNANGAQYAFFPSFTPPESYSTQSFLSSGSSSSSSGRKSSQSSQASMNQRVKPPTIPVFPASAVIPMPTRTSPPERRQSFYNLQLAKNPKTTPIQTEFRRPSIPSNFGTSLNNRMPSPDQSVWSNRGISSSTSRMSSSTSGTSLQPSSIPINEPTRRVLARPRKSVNRLTYDVDSSGKIYQTEKQINISPTSSTQTQTTTTSAESYVPPGKKRPKKKKGTGSKKQRTSLKKSGSKKRS